MFMSVMDFQIYAIAALCLHCYFISIFLFTAKKENRVHSRLLAIIFIQLSIWHTSIFLELTGVYSEHPWLIAWLTLLTPLFAPGLYFYVCSLSTPKVWSLSQQSHWHWYIGVTLVVLELFFALAPGNIKIMQLTSDIPDEGVVGAKLLWLSFTLNILQLVQFATYMILSIRALLKHGDKIRDLFSNLENKTLAWLRNYIFFVCLFIALGSFHLADISSEYSWVAHIILVMSFSLLSLQQKPVFAEETSPTIGPQENQPKEEVKPLKNKLPIERRNRIADKLRALMKGEKLYRDPDLTLRKLSDAIGVSTHHVSETLREEIGQNFYDYINSCRIAEACALLKSTSDATIDIAYAVGFNSRSTFSAAFKKHKGGSPANFRKTQIEKVS